MARVAVGDPITYAYGAERAVHAVVGRRFPVSEGVCSFMPATAQLGPNNEIVVPIEQLDEYEGSTWERGWTDGKALLAAYALLASL